MQIAEKSRPGGEPTRGRTLRPRGRRTMARLLDAGRMLVGNHGFHSVRVDDVVERAGTSHGTFYLYFSNKDDLLTALVEESREAVRHAAEAMPDPGGTPPAEAELREWLEHVIAVHRAHGPVLRAWVEAAHDVDERARRDAAITNDLRDQLQDRLLEPAARDGITAEGAATAVTAMIQRFAQLGETMGGLSSDDLETLAVIVHRGVFPH